MNQSLKGELGEGYKIMPDLSQVPALNDQFADKLKSAKILREMGAPVEVINKKLDLGISEYKGWSESVKANEKSEQEERSDMLIEIFKRINHGEYDLFIPA